MPYSYTIYPAENLTFVKASGRIRGEEVIASVEELSQDPRWQTGMHQLCDYRDVKGVAVTLAEMKHLAAIEREHFEKLKGGKLAMVARMFEVSSLCELYAIMTRFRGRRARVFYTMEAALDWLGVPLDFEDAVRHSSV